MDSAAFWWRFWEISFVIAGGSFALIALVVAVRGFTDLRNLIEFLRRGHRATTDRASSPE